MRENRKLNKIITFFLEMCWNERVVKLGNEKGGGERTITNKIRD